MNYPNHIYKEYVIKQADICGEKHYALARVYNILGIKFSLIKKVYDCVYNARISSTLGSRWHTREKIIKDAIITSEQDARDRFRRKMTR